MLILLREGCSGHSNTPEMCGVPNQQRAFKFKDFQQALAFTGRVGEHAINAIRMMTYRNGHRTVLWVLAMSYGTSITDRFSLEMAHRSSAASHRRFSISVVLAGIRFLMMEDEMVRD